MTLRQLNRTLLARRLLLRRRRMSVVDAVGHLVALQAQYPPSPYVALWSRVAGFRKEQLTGNDAIVKASTLRTTLHVMTRADFPSIVAASIDSRRGRTANLNVDIEALRHALPEEPIASAELYALAEHVLGTDDRWTIAFAVRALPFFRVGVVGPWPHTKPAPVHVWDEPLPDPEGSAVRVVRAYLAAYGPSSRADIEHFTNFRIRQIAPALEGLVERDGLYDAPGAKLASGREAAPVRFLPAYDSIILAHHDSARIVPPQFEEAVYNRKNTTTKNTFTVDGFVAGTWRVEKAKVVVEPFEPLPVRARREVDEEAGRLQLFYAS